MGPHFESLPSYILDLEAHVVGSWKVPFFQRLKEAGKCQSSLSVSHLPESSNPWPRYSSTLNRIL